MTSLGTLLNNPILVGSFENYGSGLAAMNVLKKFSSLHTIELIYRGEQTDLILVVPAGEQNNVVNELRSAKATRVGIIEQPHEDLLKAFLNLENVNLADQLVCFESTDIFQLMLFQNEMLKNGWKNVDFRLSRSTMARGSVVVTGVRSQLKDLVEEPWRKVGALTVIKEVEQPLRDYFDSVPTV